MDYVFKYMRDEHGMYRPFVQVVLMNGDLEENSYALVDSGADFSVFPSHLIPKLGLDAKDILRRSETESFGSDGSAGTAFWDVSISIEQKISLTVPIGFSDGQNQKEWGVFGRTGFFDRFLRICFHDTYLSIKTF